MRLLPRHFNGWAWNIILKYLYLITINESHSSIYHRFRTLIHLNFFAIQYECQCIKFGLFWSKLKTLLILFVLVGFCWYFLPFEVHERRCANNRLLTLTHRQRDFHPFCIQCGIWMVAKCPEKKIHSFIVNSEMFTM